MTLVVWGPATDHRAAQDSGRARGPACTDLRFVEFWRHMMTTHCGSVTSRLYANYREAAWRYRCDFVVLAIWGTVYISMSWPIVGVPHEHLVHIMMSYSKTGVVVCLASREIVRRAVSQSARHF